MKALACTAAILATMTLAGCVTKNVQISTPFDVKAASYINAAGSGGVVGQAFMRQVGGGVVTAAGEKVLLMPATRYFSEIIAHGENSNVAVNFTNIDPAAQNYVKVTTADASGGFMFPNLAAGEYIVLTQVQWGVPSRYGVRSQGGHLLQRVSVKDGETMRIIMTR